MSKALSVRRSFRVRVAQSALLLVLVATLSLSRLVADLQTRLVFWNKPRKAEKKHAVAKQES
jgi:hypothetical protein